MLNLPRWQDCTQAQHVRAGMYAYYRDEYRAALARLTAAAERCATECAADRIEPDDAERAYYGIPVYAARAESAQANAIGFASAW